MMINSQASKSVLLSTLNAKYIHTSLSLRYLQSYCQMDTDLQLRVEEFTINQLPADILAEIYMFQPDILCFSCYIWNINDILQLCADYKKLAPETLIILGGPEVSYDAQEVLSKNLFIDIVVRGEGELSLKELLLALQECRIISSINGISYRDQQKIYHNQDRDLITDLDNVPFPYLQDMNELSDRIVYYESSRGCPFSCSYCLSSTSKCMRSFSLARVKADLAVMLHYQVREIKFVDRTFNYDEKRAMEIMSFIIANWNGVKVHFEIDATILSDSMLEFLTKVPPGLFNFEIGVQSTFKPALLAVNRKQNWERLSNNIRNLKSQNNIHLHLDLIAGLPEEGYEEFSQSFNMVYQLKPDVLQLGFLKLLKGSALHKECDRYGYIYQTQAPYQVLANHFISYGQILKLSRIEKLLDWYYNSGDFRRTIAYIGQEIYAGMAMQFYQEFSDYWLRQGLLQIGHRKEAYYSYLQSFISENHPTHGEAINDLLKYDYLCGNNKYGLPNGLISYNPTIVNEQIYSYTKNRSFVDQYLPALRSRTPREIKKLLHIEYLRIDPETFAHAVIDLALMFVYNPISRVAEKVICLNNL